VQEAGTGDPEAARQRLEILAHLELLPITNEAETVARALVQERVLPTHAAEDALHLAIAVTNGVDYLLTWNCRHLANATVRSRIEALCRSRGYDPVIICTPDELVHDVED
jgi:predicted nucleic acid-binding protein